MAAYSSGRNLRFPNDRIVQSAAVRFEQYRTRGKRETTTNASSSNWKYGTCSSRTTAHLRFRLSFVEREERSRSTAAKGKLEQNLAIGNSNPPVRTATQRDQTTLGSDRGRTSTVRFFLTRSLLS